MAPDPTLGQERRAGFLPSTSAIRVLAFRGPIGGAFVESDVLELAVSRAGLERLADYVDAGFARDDAALIPIGPGPIPASHYYLARGRRAEPSRARARGGERALRGRIARADHSPPSGHGGERRAGAPRVHPKGGGCRRQGPAGGAPIG